MDVPVHTVLTGAAGLRDVAIARVLADDFAFARTAVKVEAVSLNLVSFVQAVLGSDTGLKRITVTVTSPAGAVTTLIG